MHAILVLRLTNIAILLSPKRIYTVINLVQLVIVCTDIQSIATNVLKAISNLKITSTPFALNAHRTVRPAVHSLTLIALSAYQDTIRPPVSNAFLVAPIVESVGHNIMVLAPHA